MDLYGTTHNRLREPPKEWIMDYIGYGVFVIEHLRGISDWDTQLLNFLRK